MNPYVTLPCIDAVTTSAQKAERIAKAQEANQALWAEEKKKTDAYESASERVRRAYYGAPRAASTDVPTVQKELDEVAQGR